MRPDSFLTVKPSQWGRLLLRFAASWWYMVHLGAVALVMAFSPSTYNRHNRIVTSRYIYTSTWQVLPWFTLLAALVSLVLIRIVVVTALSYGLSRYALEMVVRVLVLELIPLTAAMFVALRAGLAFNAGDARAVQVAAAAPAGKSQRAQNRLRQELVPQVIANAFAVLSLAMVSSVIVLVLAYISVYGNSPWGVPEYTRTVGRVYSPWGVPEYTRTVGRVFNPAVTAGFILKTVFFGLAVAVIPTAAILEMHRYGRRSASTVQPGAIRLLFVLLVIEAASLAVKYI